MRHRPVTPKAQKRRQRRSNARPPGAHGLRGRAHPGQHSQKPPGEGSVSRGGKGVGKAGVFCQRKTRHGIARKGAAQHLTNGKGHQRAAIGQLGPQCQAGQKPAAQADHRKSAAVRIGQDLLFFFGGGTAGQRIAGVGKAVQMNAARYQHRQKAQPRRPQHAARPQRPAQRRKAQKPRAAHQPHCRKRAQRIAHILFVPYGLGQRHG